MEQMRRYLSDNGIVGMGYDEIDKFIDEFLGEVDSKFGKGK